MADPAYSERLMAQLDGARLVRYDTTGLLLAWFGGHGVHVYDASGQEVDYWSCGDFAKDAAELEEVERSMALHLIDLDDLLKRAEEEGYERGRAAGSWVLDGNSTDESARALLKGIEDGDPMIMDALPSAPLSGEWADGLSAADLLGWYDLDEEHDAAHDVLAALETGFQRGAQDEVARSARTILA